MAKSSSVPHDRRSSSARAVTKSAGPRSQRRSVNVAAAQALSRATTAAASSVAVPIVKARLLAFALGRLKTTRPGLTPTTRSLSLVLRARRSLAALAAPRRAG